MVILEVKVILPATGRILCLMLLKSAQQYLILSFDLHCRHLLAKMFNKKQTMQHFFFQTDFPARSIVLFLGFAAFDVKVYTECLCR